jgi:hypothetical protein
MSASEFILIVILFVGYVAFVWFLWRERIRNAFVRSARIKNIGSARVAIARVVCVYA